MRPLCLHIIEQDREEMYPANIDAISVEAAAYGLVNLIMDYKGNPVILGTFETSEEAAAEVENIRTFEALYYPVGGYSNGGVASW